MIHKVNGTQAHFSLECRVRIVLLSFIINFFEISLKEDDMIIKIFKVEYKISLELYKKEILP